MASFKGILDLAEVDNEYDQGAKFQSNLQFYMDVANICAMANRTVGIIKHTFSRINIDMFRVLVKSLLRPICSTVQAYGVLILKLQLDRLNKSSVGLLNDRKFKGCILFRATSYLRYSNTSI